MLGIEYVIKQISKMKQMGGKEKNDRREVRQKQEKI